MNKIKIVSALFRTLFQFIFLLLPTLLIIGWIHAPDTFPLGDQYSNLANIPAPYYMNNSPQHPTIHPLIPSDKLAGFLVSCLPLAVKLFILYSLIQLFRLYERGEVFTLDHVRYIRNIGYALLVGEIIHPIYQTLIGIILTWHNAPGHHFAYFDLVGTNLGLILTGLFVILFSWIMAEGYKLREDQQLTV